MKALFASVLLCSVGLGVYAIMVQAASMSTAASACNQKAGPCSWVEPAPMACVPSDPIVMPPGGVPPGSMTGTFAGPFEVKVDESGGVSVVVAAPDGFKAGRYTCNSVKTREGKLVAMTPVDPRAGCVTTVTIDDQGRASFNCAKSGCNTACALNGYLNPDGSTGWKCECNLPPLPGPWPPSGRS